MSFSSPRRAFHRGFGTARRRYALGTALFALAHAVPARAEDPVTTDLESGYRLTLSGQVRPRLVLHSGLDFLGTESDWQHAVTQRARVGVALEAPNGVGFALSVQDVRVWGEEEDPSSDFTARGLDVHEAFVRLPLPGNLELRLGRQELSLDDERLVGASDFTQRARAFDGARLAYVSPGGVSVVEAFYAKIREAGTSPDGHVDAHVAGDVDFGGVHASLEVAPHQVFAPVYLVRVEQAPGDERQTLGFHFHGDGQGVSYGVEGYYQYGKLAERTIHAYAAALRAGYTFSSDRAPGITGWGEVFAGDGTPEGTFEAPYPSEHRHNGLMDLFTNIPASTADLGLVDLGMRLESGVVKELRARADGHVFRTASPAADGAVSLGEEVDLGVSWHPMDHVHVDAFYGAFFPGAAMRDVRHYAADQILYADSLVYLTTDVRF